MQFQLNEENFDLRIVRRKPTLVVAINGGAINGKEWPVEEHIEADGTVVLQIAGREFRFQRAADGDTVHLKLDGQTFSVDYIDPRSAAQQTAIGSDTVRAPMPGTVVELRCNPGANVNQGDTVMMIESMKMQVTIISPRTGTVANIHYAKGDNFDKDAVLLTLEASED